ncbi:hypothetical protein AJ79_06394 [Helicocarpus griseus UAMH5409]|uniref:Aminoglycoside phosphotransferase domain-containing protein n=1 Tax=Helicocarpus griseus UAMH5409 TaxID=1447875 RepID=A0A2B7XDS8_9EURO|nr:hypothetical protein AJ79_06394 [Helicocarpus griseus UAMH5409]
MTIPASNHDGLGWRQELFGLIPYWTKEPDSVVIDSLARKHLNLGEDALARCKVQFHAQGAFNKLYRVDTGFLMRVPLPAPQDRQRGCDDGVGFEWMLMELVHGQPLHKHWKLPWTVKEGLVKKLALYQAKLFEERFQGIRSIYQTSGKGPNEPNLDTSQPSSEPSNIYPFALGRLVSHVFFWGDHLTHNVPSGPFRNSHDWLHARLTLALTDQERILQNPSADEDDIEDAENARDIARSF